MQTKSLGKVCIVKKGQSITRNTITDGDFPVVAGGKNPAYFHNTANRKGPVITISASGANAGYVNFYNQDIFASDCSTVQPIDESVLDIKYVYAFLVSKQKEIYDLQRGAGQPHVYPKDLINLQIPLPDLATQKAIAAKLDAIQELVDQKKQVIHKTDELAKAIFVDMFGDPVMNEKGWEVKKLGDLCGVGSSKRVFVDELVEKGIPFYRGTEIGHLSEGINIEPSLFITHSHYENLKEQTGVPMIGDLLMPSICPDGRIWRVTNDTPFYFKDGRVLWIKSNQSNINSVYLQALLKEIFYADYSNIASGTTFAELKIFALKKINILCPPLPLQQQFADTISQLQQVQDDNKLALAKLEELFASTMQECFS